MCPRINDRERYPKMIVEISEPFAAPITDTPETVLNKQYQSKNNLLPKLIVCIICFYRPQFRKCPTQKEKVAKLNSFFVILVQFGCQSIFHLFGPIHIVSFSMPAKSLLPRDP